VDFTLTRMSMGWIWPCYDKIDDKR
jgi:hypothetical protein